MDRLNSIYHISQIIAAFELKFEPYNKYVFCDDIMSLFLGNNRAKSAYGSASYIGD